jgi:DNA-binding transcriptional ArsR family regulator
MSLDAILWVWDSAEPESPTDRAVLLALARHADMDGERIFPSIDRIVRMTGLSRSTVTTARRRLLESGLIEETGKSGRQTTEYRIPGVREPDGGVRQVDGKGSGSRTQKVPQKGPEEDGSTPPTSPRDIVWAHYVAVMAPRRAELDPEGAKIIDEALRVATVDECCGAIDGCAASPFHMGENDRRKKYNALSQILRGRRPGGAAPPRTTRETIDFFLDKAPAHGAPKSSATPAEISAAKRAVLDGITYPGDEHVARRGEEAKEWLASVVRIRWDEDGERWVSV